MQRSGEDNNNNIITRMMGVGWVLLFVKGVFVLLATFLSGFRHGQQTEKKRRESEPQLLMNFGDAVVIIDNNANIVDCNPATEALFGLIKSDVIGSNVEILIPRSLRVAHRGYIEKFMKSKEFPSHRVNQEMQIERVDGTKVPVLLSLSATNQGEDQLFAIFLRDISGLRIKERQSDELLRSVLPENVLARLLQDPTAPISEIRTLSIMFSDIVGFTELSSKLSPTHLIDLLCALFGKFEDLLEKYGLEKIKTIGDGFMACGGDPVLMPNHADVVVACAVDMLAAVCEFNKEQGCNWQIRIGINSGAAVAGVFSRKRMIYDLFGDEVNMASRMESTGVAGGVHISEKTYKLLKGPLKVLFQQRSVDVKGKGLVNTYLYVPNETCGHCVA